MIVLGIDTASPAVSVAAVELMPGTESPTWGRSATWRVVGGQHAELLATGIASVLREIVAQPSDVGAVAVGLGPGPYTGLRIGVMTAAAYADARDIPAYGVCSLDAVTDWDAPDEPRLVVTDARRKEVYWAEYAPDGERVAGPSVLTPAGLQDALAETGWTGRIVGAGAEKYAFPGALGPLHPDAEQVVLLAASRALAGAPAEALTPLYLRRPDATEPAPR